VLEEISPEENYLPDRELQASILQQLPENLVEELHAHLMGHEKEQRQIAEEREKEFKETAEGQVVRGELFERLAAVQYGRAGAEAQDPRLAEELSQELVQLMHNPERFTLGPQIGHIRNPDLAFFKINDQGKVEIEAAGEVKLGLLNERSADQIGGGFKAGIQKMVQAVNEVEKPEDLGLSAVAQSRARGGTLGMAEDLKVRLIVPADRNTEDKRSLVSRRDFRSEGQYFRFLRQLEKTEILKSAFGREEVARMADHLLVKIRERY
ncbi:MAG: hypothetical protein WD940_01580, partial [Patescibacteria group bacterium]